MALKREQSLPPEGTNQLVKQMVDRFLSSGHGRYGTSIETGVDEHTALRAVLLEIDETMLPRQIIIRSESNRQMTLYASNRRLLAVQCEDIDLTPSPKSPQDMAQHFAEALRSFIAETKTIRLIAPKKAATARDFGGSVSTSLLATVLGLNDTTQSMHSTDGLAALKEAAIASMHATSCMSFSEEKGSEKQLKQLQSIWREYVQATAPRFENWGAHDRKQECCAFGLDRCNYLVFARIKHATWLIALVPRKHLKNLADLGGALLDIHKQS